MPMYFLSFPHSRMRRANRKMKGTGSMLPMTETMMDGTMGRPIPTAYGMAPRSSMSGTMEMRKTMRYFFIGSCP